MGVVDGSRYGCSPSSNDNVAAYVDIKITGDFEYSIIADTTICGAGTVFGFMETTTPENMPLVYPEVKWSGVKRWGYSTICVGPGDNPGFVWSDTGSGDSRSTYSNSDDSIDVVAGDKISIKRKTDTFELLVNGVLKYTFVDTSSEDGFIFHGHYNSGSAQCFSDPTLQTPSVNFPKKVKGGWWYGDCSDTVIQAKPGGLATLGSSPVNASDWMEKVCVDLDSNDWEDGHDFSNNGNSRYGCSPGNQVNSITPMVNLVNGNFESPIVIDTVISGTGFAVGFIERNPSGSTVGTLADALGGDDTTKRWSFDYKIDTYNGEAKSIEPDNTGARVQSIGTALSAGDKITLLREKEDTFKLMINDALEHTYDLKGNGEGYIFVGHHSSNSEQCFSSPKLCRLEVADAALPLQKDMDWTKFGTTKLELAMATDTIADSAWDGPEADFLQQSSGDRKCANTNYEDLRYPKTCADVSGSGTYTIDPDGEGGMSPFPAYCDNEMDGGGWMLVLAFAGRGIDPFSLTSREPSIFIPGRLELNDQMEIKQLRIDGGHVDSSASRVSLISDSLTLISDYKTAYKGSTRSSIDVVTQQSPNFAKGQSNQCNIQSFRDILKITNALNNDMYVVGKGNGQSNGWINIGNNNNIFCDQARDVKQYPYQYVRIWIKLKAEETLPLKPQLVFMKSPRTYMGGKAAEDRRSREFKISIEVTDKVRNGFSFGFYQAKSASMLNTSDPETFNSFKGKRWGWSSIHGGKVWSYEGGTTAAVKFMENSDPGIVFPNSAAWLIRNIEKKKIYAMKNGLYVSQLK